MTIRASILAGLACLVLLSGASPGITRDWAPSPSGDCIDLDSITADASGRTYFATYRSGKLSCRPERVAHSVAVDCSQALSVASHNFIKAYAYSEGSRQWEPADSHPDRDFAATIVFACTANW
jgi:hypothetical protein